MSRADRLGHGVYLRSKKDTTMDNTVAALAEAFWTAVRREQALRSPQCPNDVLDALTLTLARMIAKYAVYLETSGVRVDVPQTRRIARLMKSCRSTSATPRRDR
jgi:hypothetical protein